MEFFIKKNATLPVLKLQVVKDGRNDFNNFMKTIELSSIFFSMVDVESGIPKISSRPGGFVEKTFIEPNAEPEYYIYYQFQNRDTNKVGRYEAQFMLRTDDGVLILPIREKLFVNVQESFVADDLPYESCYTSEFPCCQPNGITTTTTTCNCPTCPPCPSPTPTPEPVTTTTTFDPTTTTTTFDPTTTTTTTIPLETILDVYINPGSIVIDYNFSANQYVTEELQINFTHNLGTYTGTPITIITGVTIPIGEISGNTQIILNDDFNNLSRVDSFGDITTVPQSLNWVIYENYPTPTPTPTQTPTPTCLDGWVTENFSGTTYRNGDPILQATNSTEWSDANNNQTGAWCYYNFDSINGPIYGKLYNWYVVGDSRGIGSVGYIVPSESDWDSLEVCLGGNSIAGGKLKTTGTIEDNNGLWYAPNAGATNEIGFSGLPSGFMSDGGFPDLLNYRGSFWTSTEIGVGVSMVMNLNNGRTDVYHGPDTKGKGYSIRLKQGITPTPTQTSTPTPTPTPTQTSTPTITPTPTQELINPLIVGNDEYLSVGDNEYLEF